MYKIDNGTSSRLCLFLCFINCLNCILLSHQSKKRRTRTQTQSFSPWKKMTVLLGNTGERKCSSLWNTQSPFYPSALALSLLCAQICSLWLDWSSVLPPSSQPLQLPNKWPRITNNRNSQQDEEELLPCELVPPWSTKLYGFLEHPGCYLCWTLYCVRAWYDIVVLFEKQDSSGSRDFTVWVFYNFKENSQEKNNKLDSFATQTQTLTQTSNSSPTNKLLIIHNVYSIYSINTLPSVLLLTYMTQIELKITQVIFSANLHQLSSYAY